MPNWLLVLAVVSVIAGIALTVYALFRVVNALSQAEAGKAVRENGETMLLEARLRELAAAQNEIAGRFSQAIESQSRSQGDLQRAMAERLEALDNRLGENLKETAARTAETLGGLQLRLGLIDEAQKSLIDLSGQVVGLQQILGNKQARGAYGQGQMEAIVRDALARWRVRVPGDALQQEPARLPRSACPAARPRSSSIRSSRSKRSNSLRTPPPTPRSAPRKRACGPTSASTSRTSRRST